MMIAPQVVALAWLQLFGPASPVLKVVGLAPPMGSRNPLYSPQGIILVLGVQYAPLVFLTLRAGLRTLPGIGDHLSETIALLVTTGEFCPVTSERRSA